MLIVIKFFRNFCRLFVLDVYKRQALGVSLGVTLLSLPLTVVCSAVTGLLVGPAMVLLADCALRSLQNDPSQWLPRAKQTLAAHWKSACGFGCIGTLVLGLLCFVSALSLIHIYNIHKKGSSIQAVMTMRKK